MAQYVVLFPISTDDGYHVFPAAEGDPLVTLDDAALDDLFARTPRDIPRAARIQRLIEIGSLAPDDSLEALVEGKQKAKQLEAQAQRVQVAAGLSKK